MAEGEEGGRRDGTHPRPAQRPRRRRRRLYRFQHPSYIEGKEEEEAPKSHKNAGRPPAVWVGDSEEDDLLLLLLLRFFCQSIPSFDTPAAAAAT